MATGSNAKSVPNWLLVGTYTHSCDSAGIYCYSFDSADGSAKLHAHTTKCSNPSFLTVSQDRNFVYCVNEDGKQSTISCYNLDKTSHQFHFYDKHPSEGADPCYIINDDRHSIVANYSDGTLAVFEKKKDGSLKKVKQVVQHFGQSINKARQQGPHLHMVEFTPDKNYVMATDLGADRLYVYRYNPDSATVLSLRNSIATNPGGGPRHFTFSKNGRQLYLLNELDGKITAFHYEDGKLDKFQETTVVLPGATDEASGGAIKISNAGNFLYATNRGKANTISQFAIGNNGQLELCETISTKGKEPRDFAIDPSGKFLLIAHEKSDEIVIFNRDVHSGQLDDSGKRIKMCAPVCLVFLE